MPPHLHPRSTATSTLFAGTLLASFTVVAIPHIFPCPRSRRAYADAECQLDPQNEDGPGRPLRRKEGRRQQRQQTPEDEQQQQQQVPIQPTKNPALRQDPSTTTTLTSIPAGSSMDVDVDTAPPPPSLARPKRSMDHLEDEAVLFRQFQQEAEMLEKKARECPVPKPGGILGRLLGFHQAEDRNGNKQVDGPVNRRRRGSGD